MKASGDEAPPGKGRGEGWDETVLVWNATVARIPAPSDTTGRREAGPSSVQPLDPASRSRGRRAKRPSSAAHGRA